MEKYKIADEKMMTGYEYAKRHESIKACDEWLSAWEDVKSIMEENGAGSIEEIQKKYQWTDFLSNFVQDLELELRYAGLKDKEYFRRRIRTGDGATSAGRTAIILPKAGQTLN